MSIDKTTLQENIGVAIQDGDAFRAVQGGATVKLLFAQVKTYVRSWIAKSDVGLGNVVNADTTTMNNVNFTGLSPAAVAADADIFPVNQGSANLKQTFAAIKTYLKLGLASGVATLDAGALLTAAQLPVAAKSDQQAATSNVLAITPLHQQDHPSAAKAWLHYRGSGTPAVLASYNVSSVTRSSAANYILNWSTAFSSANYSAIVQGNDNTSGAGAFALLETIAAGSVGVTTVNPSTLSQADASHLSAVAFGAQ